MTRSFRTFDTAKRIPATPMQRVVDPADWLADDLGDVETWSYHLSESDIGELADGVDAFRRSGKPIEEVGRVVTHDLERFLTTLGTIASMAPLLGLFGTVIGMIEIFGSQGSAASNPIQLAHGISVALYNTAMGLIVAIPSMMFYRYFRAKVDALVVEMEQQAIKLVDFAHNERK